MIKGNQTVGDAVLAADAGAAAALSNHGGRQLDGAPAIFDLVAPVIDAVGDRIEVIWGGGVRQGSDIAKAVVAGATAVMAGRAYLYGLGAAGSGVSTAAWSDSPTTLGAASPFSAAPRSPSSTGP